MTADPHCSSPFGSTPSTNGGGEGPDRQAPPPSAHLVILRQDVVHVRHVLAGDLLDDQRAVVGVKQETFSLVIGAPGWGAAGQ